MAGPLLLLVYLLSFVLSAGALPSVDPRKKAHVPRARGFRITNASANRTDLVPNRFIVVYNANCSDAHITAHQATVTRLVARHNIGKRSINGRNLSQTINPFALGQWRGMTIEGDDDLLDQVFEPTMVNYIEQDAVVKIYQQDNTGNNGNGGTGGVSFITQSNAPSGLARLSSAAVGAAAYSFDPSAGAGITAFVVDTGILPTHSEFGGRATLGFNAVDNIPRDGNGHGTHVAATIGGETFGVAKKVQLVGVKVLDSDGEGTNAHVIAGMNFVANTAKNRGLAGKAIMNMSLGGSRSNAVNQAINALAAGGVIPVVAAGNEDQDTGNTSPGSAQSAICVGAIDQRNDTKASFSNFGTGVDVFAAGVNVLSAGIASNTATKTLSGTSMASPHVAGLAAYFLGLDKDGALSSAADVAQLIKTLAQASGATVKNNVKGTTSLIANNGILG